MDNDSLHGPLNEFTRTLDELREALFLQEPHACCDAARYYLIPPHTGMDWVQLKIGRMRIDAAISWYISVSNMCLDVSHCPWCGVLLPVDNTGSKEIGDG